LFDAARDARKRVAKEESGVRGRLEQKRRKNGRENVIRSPKKNEHKAGALAEGIALGGRSLEGKRKKRKSATPGTSWGAWGG